MNDSDLEKIIQTCPICDASLTVSKNHTVTMKTNSRDGGKKTLYLYCRKSGHRTMMGGTTLKIQEVQHIRR